jgi:hypothetical protein
MMLTRAATVRFVIGTAQVNHIHTYLFAAAVEKGKIV